MIAMWAASLVPKDGGDRIHVTATSQDIYSWEKAKPGRNIAQIRDDSFVAMYQLAHIAATRQGLFTGSLEDFVARFDLDFAGDQEDEEEEESVPTSGGASASSS